MVDIMETVPVYYFLCKLKFHALIYGKVKNRTILFCEIISDSQQRKKIIDIREFDIKQSNMYNQLCRFILGILDLRSNVNLYFMNYEPHLLKNHLIFQKKLIENDSYNDNMNIIDLLKSNIHYLYKNLQKSSYTYSFNIKLYVETMNDLPVCIDPYFGYGSSIYNRLYNYDQTNDYSEKSTTMGTRKINTWTSSDIGNADYYNYIRTLVLKKLELSKFDNYKMTNLQELKTSINLINSNKHYSKLNSLSIIDTNIGYDIDHNKIISSMSNLISLTINISKETTHNFSQIVELFDYMSTNTSIINFNLSICFNRKVFEFNTMKNAINRLISTNTTIEILHITQNLTSYTNTLINALQNNTTLVKLKLYVVNNLSTVTTDYNSLIKCITMCNSLRSFKINFRISEKYDVVIDKLINIYKYKPLIRSLIEGIQCHSHDSPHHNYLNNHKKYNTSLTKLAQ